MRLDRILDFAPWADTEACFRRDYCGESGLKDQDDDVFVSLHEEVYRELNMLSPVANDCVINITASVEGISFDVWGSRPEEAIRLGLGFTRWEEWLGMEVALETCRQFSVPEIVAHCLWEMCFYGYDQDEIGEILRDIMIKKVATQEELDVVLQQTSEGGRTEEASVDDPK